jgi:hypothetical protein
VLEGDLGALQTLPQDDAWSLLNPPILHPNPSHAVIAEVEQKRGAGAAEVDEPAGSRPAQLWSTGAAAAAGERKSC